MTFIRFGGHDYIILLPLRHCQRATWLHLSPWHLPTHSTFSTLLSTFSTSLPFSTSPTLPYSTSVLFFPSTNHIESSLFPTNHPLIRAQEQFEVISRWILCKPLQLLIGQLTMFAVCWMFIMAVLPSPSYHLPSWREELVSRGTPCHCKQIDKLF